MTNSSAVPYVLISGSYKQNRSNDQLCNFLGNRLAQHNINMISGGGKPGIKVAESMNRMLTDLNQYEHNKIVTVYRRKGNEDELKIKRIGSIRFEGNDIHEMRSHLLSNSKAMIVIGGATKTREEISLAQEQNLPVIPVGITGGTAFNVWLQYQKNKKYKNEEIFLKLNNKNAFIASEAIISILKALISKDREETNFIISNSQYF